MKLFINDDGEVCELKSEDLSQFKPANKVLLESLMMEINHCHSSYEYDGYLREKVEIGRASMRKGLGRSNDEVEARFAAKRNLVKARTDTRS